MKKEIFDFWHHQALMPDNDQAASLRKVLDPADVKGVKNSYIDAYLKYYLQEYIDPKSEDVVLEIGCGIGRMTEYLSQLVRTIYGVDIVDKFIEDCLADPRKSQNTRYLRISETEKLKEAAVNKFFISWVLMYLTDRSELIEMLRGYRKLLPNLKAAVILEQVKAIPQTESRGGAIYCCYRTVEEYREIFAASGYRVKEVHVLGERFNGPIYRFIHLACNFLPGCLVAMAPQFFLFDKKMLGGNASRSRLINNKRATDVLFCLEVA